ncbi:MAG: T9SS type A sorting domain-containing protein [Ignavibacteria bacterium]|nr:T9SS type A sorting domain-containing protein [Ignavibacteria bacterium]
MANALHYSSDHLPITALLRFDRAVSVGNYSNSVNDFKLYQNYPNPFNPSALIRFAIPKQDFVNLKIYDITGREVKVLINVVMKAGYYVVVISASDFASGVYFYSLQSGDFIQTKRMVLIK